MTVTKTFLPEVNQAAEFKEISRDFINPLEVIREAIHNSLDAKATKIEVSALMKDLGDGIEKLVITVFDNGKGMNEEGIKKFFSLGHSSKERDDETIGHKGHGTKIYFNSERVQVSTLTLDGPYIDAWIENPNASLNQQRVPEVSYKLKENNTGKRVQYTQVSVIGYNKNDNEHFTTRELVDYIKWFTKIGSFELKLYPERSNRRWAKCEVSVKGVDGETTTVQPGHQFSDECYKSAHFKKNNIPEGKRGKFFTKYWFFKNITLEGKRHISLDIFISVEGDQAKRDYNKCLKAGRREGLYTVSERYGIWLAKDYIPIQRVNEWFFDKSEWTKFHGFVNCQKFELTANRGSVENTPVDIIEKIKSTVGKIIDEQILDSEDYEDFLDMEKEMKSYRKAEGELKDFSRRKDYLRKKKIINLDDGTELIEPRQEQGVFALFTILNIKFPDVFPFKVIDYDTRQGYDALVATKTSLDLGKPQYQFIEFKFKLAKNIGHSFEKLAGIVCWDLDDEIYPDTEIADLTGNKRILKFTKDTGWGRIYARF